MAKARDFREQTVEELEKHISDLHEQLFKLRFQKATGQMENIHKIAHVRKDLARAMTVVNQKRRSAKVQEA